MFYMKPQYHCTLTIKSLMFVALRTFYHPETFNLGSSDSLQIIIFYLEI